MKFIKKHDLILLLPALLIQSLFFYQALVKRENYLYSDDAVYAILSQRILKGDFWTGVHTYWNPGFTFATIPFYLFSGSWEMAQILVSVAAIMLFSVIAFFFFKKYSIILAFTISCLIAFSDSLHMLILQGGITEPLYITFLWIAIYLGWRALNGQKLRYFFIATVVFSLAYLTRTDGLPFICLFFLLSFLKFLKDRQALLLAFLKTIAIILIFLIINIPYIYLQSAHIGRLTFSGKYAYVGSGPYYAMEKYRPTTWAQDVWALDYNYFQSPYYDPQRASSWMWKYFKNGTITQNAEKSLNEIMQNYQSINTNSFFVGWGLYLTIFGFILGFLIPKFRKLTLYFFSFWIIGVIWVAIFMSSHYRYLVFALPFFLYLEGLAIYCIVDLINNLLVIKQKNVKFVLAIISLWFFLGIIFRQNINPVNLITPSIGGLHQDHKMLGDWIRNADIKIIGGRMEAIAFYSGAKLVYMPSSPPNEIIDYMKAWGVEYLLVRPNEVGYAFVAPIADPNFQHPDLILYKKFEDGSLIWKIKLTEEERKNNQRSLVEKQYWR